MRRPGRRTAPPEEFAAVRAARLESLRAAAALRGSGRSLETALAGLPEPPPEEVDDAYERPGGLGDYPALEIRGLLDHLVLELARLAWQLYRLGSGLDPGPEADLVHPGVHWPPEGEEGE